MASGGFRDSIQRQTRRTAERLVAPLARTGLTPNGLTVIGFLLSVVAGVVLALGNSVVGGVLVLFAGSFDTLDGALARATGQETVFGKFFDSTMDRFSEAVILLGIAVGFLREPMVESGDVAGVALSFLVMIGSIMISYARARAEGLEPRVDCEVGWLQRPERILILGVGLLLPQSLLLVVLAVLAVLTHVTVGQRIAHVRRLTQGA